MWKFVLKNILRFFENLEYRIAFLYIDIETVWQYYRRNKYNVNFTNYVIPELAQLK